MLRVLVLLTLTCSCHVTGFPTGPPENACEMMKPSHGGNNSPQTGTPPYTLTIGQTTYAPNEKITGTLSGTPDFKGFFIQARPSAGNTWVTYGTFATPIGTKNPCAGVADGGQGPRNAAISHNSRNAKSAISAQWTAPATDVGDIKFLFTVVQDKATYWVLQAGPTLSFSSTAEPTTPFTGTVTIPSSTPTQGPTSPPGTFDRDPRCGATLSCFPDSCVTDCDLLVMWRKLNDSDVEFTVKKHAPSTGYWVAVGFSADRQMGDDSVVECLKGSDGTVSVKSSYNKNEQGFKFNDAMTPSDYGLSSTVTDSENGIVTCTFRRKINAALADAASGAAARRRRAVDGNDVYFVDLDSEWYLFSAWGAYDGVTGDKSQHSGIARSDVKYNFLAVTDEPEPTTVGPQTGVVTKNEGCGQTLGCFGDCTGDTCDFLFTWKDMGDDIAITMSAKRSGNTYFAVGMSKDDKMGDDSVMECTSNAGSAMPYVSYNVNSGKWNERLDDGQFGLSGITGSHVDGVLKCSFSRKKTFALASGGSARRKRAATAASTYFDMNSDFTLFAAFGPSVGGAVDKHSSKPLASPVAADFQSTDDIGAEAVKHPLIKVHGILMVTAWMFCATVGIFMARYYKDVWPEGSECCGQKRWFVVHRGLMMMAFLSSATGFVLIFIHVKGWAEIDGPTFHKSHPIIGTIVMGLALINPIMAFFRPHPGTPKRPLFKAAHTLVGIAAFVLGVVNIVSGTLLSAANVADYTTYIVYGFIGWVALIDIILVIYDCSKSNNVSPPCIHVPNKVASTSDLWDGYEAPGEAYEMQGRGAGSYGKPKSGVDKLKVFILVLHVPIVLALAVAVCVIIGVVEKE